ncbi:MAG: hypothetical protein IH944_02590 [Armatimonadetes bacterium]|nr:hypothetical protein [Armatimonadota bacterium]
MLETRQGSFNKVGQGQPEDTSDNGDETAQTQHGCPVLGRLIVAGANFRTANLAVRSSLAITEHCLGPFLRGLQEQGVEECFALSTCNRVEVYALTPRNEIVLKALSDRCGSPFGSVRDQLYVHAGTDAIKHLLRVVWPRIAQAIMSAIVAKRH